MGTLSMLDRDVTWPRPEVESRLPDVARQLREDVERCAAAVPAEHLAAALSAADLMAVLLARHLRYDYDHPDAPGNDALIFSAGHASPLYYAMLRAVGAIGEEELLSYARPRIRLDEATEPRLPGLDAAAGSHGHGLPVGVGVALAGRRLDRLPYRVWVLCAASELGDGSTWEAAEQAADGQLGNLTLLVDVSQSAVGSGVSKPAAAYADRFRAFGWQALEVDARDEEAADLAMATAAACLDKPTIILSRASAEVGAAPGPAGKTSQAGESAGAGNLRLVESSSATSQAAAPGAVAPRRQPPAYPVGSAVSTSTAFGEAMAALGDARPDVVVLDGAADEATPAAAFAAAHPDRFFECRAAQQLLATAAGLQARGWAPFAVTQAANLTQAHDVIRLAALSGTSFRLAGTHTGVWGGEGGPARLALADIAALRGVPGSTVLCPADANQTAALTDLLADLPGVSYLRTCDGDAPVIYPPGERFAVGGSRVLRSDPADQVTLIAAGVTVHEALAAADLLAEDGIMARVIDAYSVKPVDAVTLRAAARETGRIVTVEDHWPEGGLGDAVLSALAGAGERPMVRKLAVRRLPGSAALDLKLQLAGIDMASIATAAAELVDAGQA
jgi:transketolase